MPYHVEEFIKKANQPESEKDEKITCVIADLVVAWALEIANKMGLKGAIFLSSAPGIVSMVLQIPHLIEAGIIDAEGTPKKKEKVMLSPYLPALSSDDYVWNVPGNKELQKVGFELVRSGEPFLRTSNWVLCNWTCICDRWKVGLELKPDEDGIFTRHEIKSKVDELLINGGIRENALKIKRLAQMSLSEGGSSSKNLEQFVAELVL
ncbi:hypothetical protein D5086_024122 [Populus alba]|uniref:Uncharacterized protein n=1 Tax=Populus alba TaxID=43335 RepID=A0ACC4B4K3_POPAL